MTMTGAIKGQPKAKVSKSCLAMLLYSLQTQDHSPFPAKLMKTTNNERFYIN